MINMITILLIAVALAMDAFAVALASGISLKKVNIRQTFRLSWHFGLFQSLMPIAGWRAGTTVYHFIERLDHWVAFFLLFFIGFRMILGNIKPVEHKIDKKDPTKGTNMVVLSVATSIDAFAVGLSMSILQISIWLPALIIGLVAALFTIIGLHLGRLVSSNYHLGNYAEIVGGILLWGIGFKILFEHAVF